METVQILNVNFSNLTEKEFFENCKEGLIITPNVDFLIHCQNDQEFYEIVRGADYVLCDSQLIFLASKILKKKIKEKLSGSDVFPRYCDYHRRNEKVKIFLMGAMEGVAAKAAENINRRCEREIIVGHYCPKFGYEDNEEETNKMIKFFNSSGANVFALGTGCPKSEKWFQKNRKRLNADIMFCIGATIDFEAGNVRRAPKWVSVIGMEWFFRLMKEPKRLWKRYLIDDPIFFWLIFKEKFGLYRNPMKPKGCEE